MNLKSLIPFGHERTNIEPTHVAPVASLHQEIDRLFDNFGRGFAGIPSLVGGHELVPRMDVGETDKTIEVTVELPGLEEKDVDINFVDDVLSIRGEKKSEKEEKDKDYHLVERHYGAFARSVTLPAGTDPASIKATIDKGVLKVTVQKPAAKIVQKIEVKTAA
jgi:HSP20 family protein